MIVKASAHGADIPVIGFGTSMLGGKAAEAVATALKVGYRHIDAARKYGTEDGVGDGIRASGVARGDIFLTTKVSHENLHTADFVRSTQTSLKALQVDYVDLLLVHWPNPAIPLAETMDVVARMKREGLTRHIGVANFPTALLDEAIHLCPEPLVTDQVEYHANLDQTTMLNFLRRHDMILTAYCPLGRGRLVNDPAIGAIARRKGKTIAQVALRWLIQQPNVVAIPRSSNPQRIAENFDIFDFTLSDEELSEIAALRRAGSRIADPAGRAPAWDE